MNEELFRLDLAQVERVRRLHARLAHGIRMYDQYMEAVAIQETRRDAEKVGMALPTEQPDSPEVAIEKLRSEQGKVLSTLKAAVWNASDGLRRDHQKRRELQVEEPAE